MSDVQNPTHAERTCGTCMMCCKTLTVPELEKPAGTWCGHAVMGKGCSIHGAHPPHCQRFFCLWITQPSFGAEWKPDRSRFVLSIGSNGGLLVSVDPQYPTAWRKEPYISKITRFAAEGAAKGRFLFIRTGKRCIVLLPDGEHDLGEVSEQDGVHIQRTPGAAGLIWKVEVRPA